MGMLEMNIVTPKGTYGPYYCDSIHVTVCDTEKGNGGGSYGIRSKHVKSLFALEEGTVDGFHENKLVVRGKSGSGFATIDQDIVTVVIESFENY